MWDYGWWNFHFFFLIIVSVLFLKKSHGHRNGWGEYSLSNLAIWFKPISKQHLELLVQDRGGARSAVKPALAY